MAKKSKAKKTKIQKESQEVITKSPEATPASGQTILGYQGNVKITYKTNSGKEITLRRHNEGLNAMFKYICKALCGDVLNASIERPSYVDLKCIYNDDTDITGSVTKTDSCLYSPIAVSSPEYYYDTTTLQWATRFNITISYNMINFDIVNSHLNGNFYIYLTTATNSEFARFSLDDNQGSKFKQLMPGTNMILEWIMLFKNIIV